MDGKFDLIFLLSGFLIKWPLASAKLPSSAFYFSTIFLGGGGGGEERGREGRKG